MVPNLLITNNKEIPLEQHGSRQIINDKWVCQTCGIEIVLHINVTTEPTCRNPLIHSSKAITMTKVAQGDYSAIPEPYDEIITTEPTIAPADEVR